MAPNANHKKNNQSGHNKGKNHHSHAAKKPKVPRSNKKNKVLIPKPPPALVKFPYVALTAAEELKTMKVIYILFWLKIYKLLMILHAVLCSRNLASATDRDIDFKDLLRITKDENLNNPTGFMPNPISANDVQQCITTRNHTDHLQLNDIQQHWRSRISSYAILCDSANNPTTATELRTVSSQMNAGNFTGIVQFTFTFSSSFSHPQGFGISIIMYGILLRYLAKIVRTFLIGKLGFPNITLDLHANLQFIKDKLLTNPNYIDVGGWQRGDASLFQRLFDTRLCYAHGWFVIAWHDWQDQLQDIIDAQHLLKAHTEAAVVQDIFDKLVRYKNDGLLVTDAEFNVMDL
jgi:hypothetical protein